MCYDISFKTELKELADYFPELVYDDQISMNFDAAIHIQAHAYGEHPIIYRNKEDGKLHLKLMEWGCIPFYVKDEKSFLKQRRLMLNARSERILEDEKSYWFKIRNRRCLIPVNGIFEHRGIKGWKNKVPYFIQLRKQPMFFIPGLYSVVDLPDRETGEIVKRWTYTLITRAANDVMKMIHNDGENRWRMPLFLPFELSKKWVDEELSLDDYKAILNFEMPSEELNYYPVLTIRGSKPYPVDRKKTDPYEWERLPELGTMDPELKEKE